MHDILNGFINDWSRKVDETKISDKKVNKHYMSGLFCASLATYIIPNVTFSRQLLIPNKTLSKALDPRANGDWLSKLSE